VLFSASLRAAARPDCRRPYGETFALANVAEEAGFKHATIGQHHFREGDRPTRSRSWAASRPGPARSASAPASSSCRARPAAGGRAGRDDRPAVRGRISLGVGVGWNPFEYEVLGVPFAERGARMEEALQLMRTVWTQQDTSFAGRFYAFPELTVFRGPCSKPSPPLWVAGTCRCRWTRAAGWVTPGCAGP